MRAFRLIALVIALLSALPALAQTRGPTGDQERPQPRDQPPSQPPRGEERNRYVPAQRGPSPQQPVPPPAPQAGLQDVVLPKPEGSCEVDTRNLDDAEFRQLQSSLPNAAFSVYVDCAQID